MRMREILFGSLDVICTNRGNFPDRADDRADTDFTQRRMVRVFRGTQNPEIFLYRLDLFRRS